MKKFAFVLILMSLACAPGSTPSKPPPAGDPDIVRDYASLVAHLRSSDLRVEEAGTVEQPFFGVPGRVLRVNGDDVQVFEYPSAQAAESDAAKVNPGGGSIGTTMVTWIAPPHFFRKGRLLVIYLGDQRQVHDVLQGVFGPQFAGR